MTANRLFAIVVALLLIALTIAVGSTDTTALKPLFGLYGVFGFSWAAFYIVLKTPERVYDKIFDVITLTPLIVRLGKR